MLDVLPLVVAIKAQLTLQRQDNCVCAALTANLEFAPVLLPAWISLLGKPGKEATHKHNAPIGKFRFRGLHDLGANMTVQVCLLLLPKTIKILI